jgi:hypothetical protein
MTIAALDFMPFIWVAIVILSVVLEIFSHDRVVLAFAFSAFVSFALVFFGVRPRIQTVVFFAASAVIIVADKVAVKRIREMKNALAKDDINNDDNENEDI